MRLLNFFLLVLACALCTVCAKPTNTPDEDSLNYPEDDYGVNGESDGIDTDYGDNGDDGEEEMDLPTIESIPLNLNVHEGETIDLPCSTKNGESYVIMWWKGSQAIAQGKSILGSIPNMVVTTNSTLRIKNITEEDAGEYMCKVVISKTENVNITHQVSIDAAPKIASLTAKDNKTRLQVGDNLDLICNATGEPKPKIKWYFVHKYQGMEDDQKSEYISEGEELTIENVEYKRTGYYRCLADNGGKNPAHASIFIDVIHKPVVSIEKIFSNHIIHQLVCTVHASPVAQVHWQKNGKHLPRNDHVKQTVKDHEHRITFSNFKESDAGEYKCIAKNDIGEEYSTVPISLVPEGPIFVASKPHKSNGYSLEWSVHSHFKVLESVITYREKGQTQGKEDYANVNSVDSNNNFVLAYTFKDLKKGSYSVKIKAKNIHGWSMYSNEANFEITGSRHSHKNKHHGPQTKDNDIINRAESHTEVKEPENQEEAVRIGSQISDSGSLNLLPSIMLLCTTFILLRP